MEILIDELARLSGETKIKVGAKSSYFFCGTVNELCKKLEEYNEAMRTLAMRNAVRAELQKKRLFDKPPSLTRYATKECEKPDPKPSLEDWNKKLENWFNDCVEAELECRKTKVYYDNFVELPDRGVANIYKADKAVDEDVTIIVIEGNELGKFWTFGEAGETKFGMVGVENESM